MRKRCLVIAAGAWLAACAVSGARDQVRTTTGKVLPGRVLKMSPVEVKVDIRGLETLIAVNEIVSISYDDEPSQLKSARKSIAERRYNDALTALGKVKDEVTRREILQDIEFYKALCAAKMAMGGIGTIKDAGGKMLAFVNKNPGSYHYLYACEVVGDLLVAMQRYALAEKYYKQVASAPWEDYKMRAGVKIGLALLAQRQSARALATFEKVLQSAATGKLAEAQRMAATLGKARCLAATRQPAQQQAALKMINNVIANADPEQIGLHARAYNAQGGVLRNAGRDKEALLAFLHVHVLYNRMPEAHAEALYNLVQLWKKLHKSDRAVEARKMLKNQYGNTSWGKKEE